jgi:hypothetical protein
MDEAGNVAPWPTDQLGATETVTVQPDFQGVLQGRNWKRFFVPGRSSVVDTTLAVDFRYDNPDFDLGAVTIIEYPADVNRKILGYFDVGAVTGELAPDEISSVFVLVELEQEGQLVFRIGLPATGQSTVRVTLPADARTAPGNRVDLTQIGETEIVPGASFTLGSPTAVVNYAFRANTVVVYTNGYVLKDTSPANFSFKVVPKSIEQYLESSGGQQPIKVFERE